MFTKPVKTTLKKVEAFFVEYRGCGSHEMNITFESYHPYDLAAALREAANDLEAAYTGMDVND